MSTPLLDRRATTPLALSIYAPGRPHHRRGVLEFFVLAAFYFVIGYVLVMRYNLIDPDATSRVANAGYVIRSRDPHLSAIGFVWNPLPSLVEIPVLLFDRWWPELRTHGVAGVVQSALFMAGAASMVRGIAYDRGLSTRWRKTAIASFALNPMIILYGASGMSEAAEMCCLLWCVRYLMRWSDRRSTTDLAMAGLALGVGYTARYEVAVAALGAAVFVVVVAGRRAVEGSRRSLIRADVVVVLFPITLAASVWALTGWIVNSELFAQFSSQYGNSSQVGARQEQTSLTGAWSSAWVVIAARILGMQPFVGIAVAGALIYAVVTRRPAPLVPVITFGAVLAFAAWGQHSGSTFGWFRFYLMAIPLVTCVALAAWPPADATSAPSATDVRIRRSGSLLLIVSILIAFPVTVRAMLNEHIGNQTLQSGFNSLLHPDRFPPSEQWYRRLLINDRMLAGDLDRQRLPDGAVLMDTFNTWGVWLSSDNPKQFIITSDYDFKAALNQPWEYGVKYLLVSNPAIPDVDALNVRYPNLWDDGAGIAKLIYSISSATGEARFRLFEVTHPPDDVMGPPIRRPRAT